MKAIVKLKIERFEEQGQEYFVATSDDLQGLVAEGNTVEEAVAIAEDLAHHLLELDRKQENVINNFQTM
jgi:predicted RNase H-like HicB family nuclease